MLVGLIGLTIEYLPNGATAPEDVLESLSRATAVVTVLDVAVAVLVVLFTAVVQRIVELCVR